MEEDETNEVGDIVAGDVEDIFFKWEEGCAEVGMVWENIRI